MNTVYSKSLLPKDILHYATVEKGQLKISENGLYLSGHKVATLKDKINQLFLEIVNTLQFGHDKAVQKKVSFFSNKTIKLIDEYNRAFLTEKIQNIGEEQLNKYLSILDKGEILSQDSPHWARITSLHQSYNFIEEIKKNSDSHWLYPFMTTDDLGVQLENLDLFRKNDSIDRLVKLDLTYRSAGIPDFVPLLQTVLGNSKIRNISNEQLQDLDAGLKIYSELPFGADRLEKAKQLLTLSTTIKKHTAVHEKREFHEFLIKNPVLANLIALLSPTIAEGKEVTQILKIQKLAVSFTKLPADFYFCQTMDELIKKMEDKQATEISLLPAEDFGKFAAFFNALKDKEPVKSQVKELKALQETFALCGKKGEFIQLLNNAVNNGFKDSKGCVNALNKFHSDNKSSIYAIHLVAMKTEDFVDTGLDQKKIREFQQIIFTEIESVSTQMKVFLQGEEAVRKSFEQTSTQFNKAQLAEAKKEWSRFGPQMLEHLTKGLDAQIESGEKHFKQLPALMSALKEIHQIRFQSGAEQLEAEFGQTLSSHAMVFLISEEGKKRREDPNFFKSKWPQLISDLRAVNDKFISQGIPKETLGKYLDRFLTTSAYANSQDQWLVFDSPHLDKFSKSVRFNIFSNELDSLIKTHGNVYVDCLMEYLTDNEPDVLNGDVFFKDAQVFQATPIHEQIKLYLLPYLTKKLTETRIFDKEIISALILKEPLVQENFKNHLEHIGRLQSLLPKGANEREKQLFKELIRVLHPNYLAGIDLAPIKSEHINKAERDAIEKIIKFCCNKGDKQGVYAPDMLARVAVDLIRRQGKPDDSSAMKLQSAAHACDAIFNDDLIAQFKSACFKMYVQDVAKKTCEDKLKTYPDINKLTEGLINRFSKTETGLNSASAVSYIDDLVSFAVNLALTYPVPYYTITDALASEQHSPRFTFNLETLKQETDKSADPLRLSIDIKDKLTAKIKSHIGLNDHLRGIVEIIKLNPFSIVNTLIPSFVENLLSPEDKSKAATVSQSLTPLGPLFNQSAIVNKGLSGLAKLLEIVSINGIESTAKEFIINQITGFNEFDLNEMSKLNDRDSYRQSLDSKGLSIWMTMAEVVSDKIIDIHAKMHAATKPEKPDALVDFMSTDLPNLIEDLDSIKSWINRLPIVIPLIRKFGSGWLVHKILNRYLSSKLESVDALDNESKKLIVNSLETILPILLLTVPSINTNHNLDVYFEFVKYLNQTMQRKEKPDGRVLLVDIMKIMQQGTKEAIIYRPIIEQAVNQLER